MKKHWIAIVNAVLALAVLILCLFAFVLPVIGSKDKETEVDRDGNVTIIETVEDTLEGLKKKLLGGKENSVRTLAEWTDVEEFATVPVLQGKDTGVSEARDAGAGWKLLTVNNTTLDDYKNYLKTLKENGFTEFVNNEEGIGNGMVYSATYTKDELTLTVTQLVKLKTTYLSVSKKAALSEHLNYSDKYMDGVKEGSHTKFHQLELSHTGNSYLIQLKNGHFVMNDGAELPDGPTLISYMESLVPAGEKPVIEAWFISHPHTDHYEVLRNFISDTSYSERVYVEGLYFSQPNEAVGERYRATKHINYIEMARKCMRTTKGETTPMYRPQMGQTYYFCDIKVDVVWEQEKLPFVDYSNDLNDSSLWLRYNIEGQTILLCGDADEGSARSVTSIYNRDYFDLDIYVTFHHGINTWDPWTDFINYKTLMYSWKKSESSLNGNETYPQWWKLEENAHMREKAQEILNWGDGTNVLTFPYTIGTTETMPHFTWEGGSN